MPVHKQHIRRRW